MRWVECSLERHGEAILAILNDAIVHSTALYDYHPRPPEAMTTWFANKAAGKFPVIGVENDDGVLMGFASYGQFRAFPAYKYTVEHSVYVRQDFRERGLGRLLLEALVQRAQEQGYHVVMGVIDADNQASIQLHERLGFVTTGVLRQVGFKFGRWLDVALMQKQLPTPHQPVDG